MLACLTTGCHVWLLLSLWVQLLLGCTYLGAFLAQEINLAIFRSSVLADEKLVEVSTGQDHLL